MFNCHDSLNIFFEGYVRLKGKHDVLRDYRDKNLERIRSGIDKLKEKKVVPCPCFKDNFSQGSMAMATINQAQHEDDHDIDHAIIFDADEVHVDPQSARDFVASALAEEKGNFKKDPEARTNAVTVWYQDGYHVDFAIYKRVSDGKGGYDYYHSGLSWTKRNPKAITDWFIDRNQVLSPQVGTPDVKVQKNQLRKVVRLLKFWAKSRPEWSLPSGLVLSVLAIDNYCLNNSRDDVAFADTFKKILAALNKSREVMNPVDKSISLIITDDHRNQMSSLVDKMVESLDALALLESDKCNKEKSDIAWATFFNNDAWTKSMAKSENATDRAMVAFDLSKVVRVSYSSKSQWGSRMVPYDPDGKGSIPKGAKVKFEVTIAIPYGTKVSWEVRNKGDEAKWKNQLVPRPGQVDESNTRICYEDSAFRGNHTMYCSIEGTGIKFSIPVRIR